MMNYTQHCRVCGGITSETTVYHTWSGDTTATIMNATPVDASGNPLPRRWCNCATSSSSSAPHVQDWFRSLVPSMLSDSTSNAPFDASGQVVSRALLEQLEVLLQSVSQATSLAEVQAMLILGEDVQRQIQALLGKDNERKGEE